MNGTIRLDDMRIFAGIAEAGSLSAAARALGMPKQTLSRRLAQLEAALGVALAQRTTRRLRLTDVGAAYAARCADLVRLADEAHALVRAESHEPRGQLRITADPTLGEAALAELVAEYLLAHPGVQVETILTSRYVDLVEEGFDVALRVGKLADSSLIALRLGPARLVYCAAPSYLRARGVPRTPDELLTHDCVVLAPGPEVTRWPFSRAGGESYAIEVKGRVRVNSLVLARRAALDGLGVVNLPAFACRDDLASGRLRAVLEDQVAGAGGVYLVYPQHRFLAPRVRAFIDLAARRFGELLA